MLTKILIFLAVLVGVFVVARMGASSAIKPSALRKRQKSARVKRAEEMIACPTCGAYVARGDVCPCGGAPTP